MTRILLAVDPQSSFCNPIQTYPYPMEDDGELYVPGADEDMERLGKVAETVDFDDIIITLDSHEFLHISHPIWFRLSDEKEVIHPSPFTRMCVEDGEIIGYVQDECVVGTGRCVGRFKTTIENLQEWTIQYIKTLTSKGKSHIIWPTHCIMGTKGHRIMPSLMKGILAWERKQVLAGVAKSAKKIMKGKSIYTEFHSVIRPAVQVPFDKKNTEVNVELLNYLSSNDVKEIVIGGEAMNVCVLDSVVDIVKIAKVSGVADEYSARIMAQKIILLTDAMSEVPNCGDIGEKFIKEMKSLGMRTSTCAEYIEMAS